MKTKQYQSDGINISTKQLEIQGRQSVEMSIEELKLLADAFKTSVEALEEGVELSEAYRAINEVKTTKGTS